MLPTFIRKKIRLVEEVTKGDDDKETVVPISVDVTEEVVHLTLSQMRQRGCYKKFIDEYKLRSAHRFPKWYKSKMIKNNAVNGHDKYNVAREAWIACLKWSLRKDKARIRKELRTSIKFT